MQRAVSAANQLAGAFRWRSKGIQVVATSALAWAWLAGGASELAGGERERSAPHDDGAGGKGERRHQAEQEAAHKDARLADGARQRQLRGWMCDNKRGCGKRHSLVELEKSVIRCQQGTETVQA